MKNKKGREMHVVFFTWEGFLFFHLSLGTTTNVVVCHCRILFFLLLTEAAITSVDCWGTTLFDVYHWAGVVYRDAV